MNSSTYPTSFASPNRDSFAPVVTHAKGKIAWAKDIGLVTQGGLSELLMLGQDIVVNSGFSFALFTPTGDKKWETKKGANGPVAIANSQVYYEAPGFVLESVDASGAKLLSRNPYPVGGNDQTHATLLWPREKDFVMATHLGSPQYDEEDPGDANMEQEISGYRYLYGQRLPEWAKGFTGGQSLPPLFVPEKNRWIMSQPQVTSIDLTDGTKAEFPIPLDAYVAWSADAAGIFVVLGAQMKKQTMVALASDGKELWRFVNPDPTGAWVPNLPPARSRDGKVWALTQRQVLAIADGKLLWIYDLADEAVRAGAKLHATGSLTDKDGHPVLLDKPAFVTVLADGSILFVAGNGLRKLDPAGRQSFLLRAQAPIIAPAVVDPSGAIYLLTATQLVRVD